jgi:hypothetical protein
MANFIKVLRKKHARAALLSSLVDSAVLETKQHGDTIWPVPWIKSYMTFFFATVPLWATSILFLDFEPYGDLWKRDNGKIARELASLLAYILVINAFSDDDDIEGQRRDDLMHPVAAMFPANERVVALLQDYHRLIEDPQEMRDREILGAFPGCEDKTARGVIFPYIVNETIGGPRLNRDAANAPDPSQTLWLHQYMNGVLIETVKNLRELKATVSFE